MTDDQLQQLLNDVQYLKDRPKVGAVVNPRGLMNPGDLFIRTFCAGPLIRSAQMYRECS
jgi:hypothetical protein